MAQKPFIAKSGIVSGNLTISNTNIIFGSDIAVTSLDIQAQNSVANSVINRTSISVSNASGVAVQLPTQFGLSNSTVAANLLLTGLYVGNSTVNVVANGIALILSSILNVNSTGLYHTGLINGATLSIAGVFTANSTVANTPGLIVVGQANTNDLKAANSIVLGNTTVSNSTGIWTTAAVNAASFSVGTSFVANSTTLVIPSITLSGQMNVDTIHANTSVGIGANVLLTGAQFSIGNATVNSALTVNQLSFANNSGASSLSNLSGFFVGTQGMSGSNITLGANVVIDPTQILLGNSTANVWANSTQLSIATGASNVMVISTKIAIGSNTLLDTGQLFIGNSTVNTEITAGSISLSGVALGGVSGLVTTSGNTNLTGGFTVTSANLGVLTSFTVNFLKGQYQYGTGNSAITITAPAADGGCDILITNGNAAGTISFSGFTVGSSTGDSKDTTSGHQFILSVRRINAISTYAWKALQ